MLLEVGSSFTYSAFEEIKREETVLMFKGVDVVFKAKGKEARSDLVLPRGVLDKISRNSFGSVDLRGWARGRSTKGKRTVIRVAVHEPVGMTELLVLDLIC